MALLILKETETMTIGTPDKAAAPKAFLMQLWPSLEGLHVHTSNGTAQNILRGDRVLAQDGTLFIA
jgi:hypothetical protein